MSSDGGFVLIWMCGYKQDFIFAWIQGISCMLKLHHIRQTNMMQLQREDRSRERKVMKGASGHGGMRESTIISAKELHLQNIQLVETSLNSPNKQSLEVKTACTPVSLGRPGLGRHKYI